MSPNGSARIKDVLITISGALAAPEGQSAAASAGSGGLSQVQPAQTQRFKVEARIDGGGAWTGISTLDLNSLDLGSLSKREYGIALGKQILNRSVERALEQAGLGTSSPVRVRLALDNDVSTPHFLRWERLYLDIGGACKSIATSPEVSFSRYVPLPREDTEPPEDTTFRLLIAVSNPSDLPKDKRINVEKELGKLLESFEKGAFGTRFKLGIMTGRSKVSDALKQRLENAGWELSPGKTTLDNISRWVHKDGGWHAVHVICHGSFDREAGTGRLLLESDEGDSDPVEDLQLQSWIHPKLQLAVFQACRTAANGSKDDLPFAGIAAKIVSFGVPAVIAMQDYILMDDARAFAASFYASLLRDGDVHKAVNDGRRAIPNAEGREESTIPALFTRLKGGRLWQPDPVRHDILNTLDRIPEPPALPLKAVHEPAGVRFNPDFRSSGPVYDLKKRLDELVDRQWMTCLTGPPGFDKTMQLYLQYRRLANAYLRDDRALAPFLVGLTELSKWGRIRAGSVAADYRGNMQAVAGRQPVPDELKGRKFVFLVEWDEDLSDGAYADAIDSLLTLLRGFEGSRCLLINDEPAMSKLRERIEIADPAHIDQVDVLVTRLMDWSDVRRYLKSSADKPVVDLAESIEKARLTDLAGIPWLLSRLQEFARWGKFAHNRCEALSLISSSYLSKFDTQRAPRICAEQTLERVAWKIQMDRLPGRLEFAALTPILCEVRDRRDFRLGDLRDELIRCEILSSSGEEGVRFGYPPLQAYYAARYLQSSSQKMALLEDISASLGRLSRMRHWEHVLVALAGLQRRTEDQVALLQTILAGSSLAEGEQVYLASKMYVEMTSAAQPNPAQNGTGNKLAKDKVVRQMIDTLAWRSLPDTPRPYSDRRQSVEGLANLCHVDAIRHLIRLAIHKFSIPAESSVPSNGSIRTAKQKARQELRFDNSGIRMQALKGLLRQQQETANHLQRETCQAHGTCSGSLRRLIAAWSELDKDLSKMVAILEENDAGLSSLAAFALGEAGMARAGTQLLDVYFGTSNKCGTQIDPEVSWAITEVLSAQDAQWLYDKVIRPRLQEKPGPSRQLCFLIQRMGQPHKDVLRYLHHCLRQPVPHAHDRALRALSKLNDAEENVALIDLCHRILKGDWPGALQSPLLGIRKPPILRNAFRMQQAALEILRDIGSEESMEVVRDSRLNLDTVLAQLSYQVAEEIYWRLTGGIARENFAGAFSYDRTEKGVM